MSFQYDEVKEFTITVTPNYKGLLGIGTPSAPGSVVEGSPFSIQVPVQSSASSTVEVRVRLQAYSSQSTTLEISPIDLTGMAAPGTTTFTFSNLLFTTAGTKTINVQLYVRQ